MNARSALFDVYGDHLRQRGGVAPVASLLRLLAPVGVAAPAVRTAISRMVAQGWLAPVRLEQGAGYQMTDQAERRLSAAARRIYRTGSNTWDGRWHVLMIKDIQSRSTRERIRSGLTFLGYAPLGDSTWVSPHASAEVEALLAGEGVVGMRFSATYDGDAAALAASAWDLDDIDKSYLSWLAEASGLLGDLDRPLSDEEAFRLRSALVHEWRKFLFRDPALPRELLPERWAGDAAARFFDEQAARLAAGASRFVDRCLLPT